ncbi:14210_t:CDS:2, partial [Gigaspora rosea]
YLRIKMNKNQLRELLEGLTTFFAEVANMIANTRREPKDKREYLTTMIDAGVHVMKKDEEPTGRKSYEKKHRSTNYVGWLDLYDNSQEAWDETEIYALGEKRSQPYPSNSNREKRIQTQPVETWEN